MPEPTSPLPWRIGKVQILTGQGYEEWDGILDAKGEAVLVLSNNQEYITEAANAYPRLGRALEACRKLLACECERKRRHLAIVPSDRYLAAVQAAREALEMAEGRDGEDDPERV